MQVHRPKFRVGHLFLRAVALAWLVCLWLALAKNPDPQADSYTYWFAAQSGVNPYGREWSLEHAAYAYPPPFLQAISPIAGALEWPEFHAVWTAALMLGVVWLVGPLFATLLLLPLSGSPTWESVIWGNIEVPMVVALILVARWPAAWAFISLTKVTTGVGVLWHLGRREWRRMGSAAGAMAVIALVSFAAAPQLWAAWVIYIGNVSYQQPFAAPLEIRVGLAGTLVVLGGMTRREWTVPIAVVVAHPAIWLNSLAIPILWSASAYLNAGPYRRPPKRLAS